MKYLLILSTACCLLPLGCRADSLAQSGLPGNLLGLRKSEQSMQGNSLAANTPDATKAVSATGSPQTTDYDRGEQAFRSGDLKEARKHFQKVVQNDPNNPGAHHRLGYIADKNKEYAIAEIHYLAAMRIQPRNPDICCDLGYSYLLQDRLEDSRRYLEKAISLNPNHQASLLNLATLHGKQGDYAGALALFRQAGNEQEAQANIARLFPSGPPAGGQVELASNSGMPGNPARDRASETTRELQEKLANAKAGQQKPLDIQKLDPREIPPDQINDLFSRIDAQYDETRLNAPHISPTNHTQDAAPFPAARMQHAQHATPAPPTQGNSLPGELPLQAPAGPYGDYAVVMAEPPQQTPSIPSARQESPYFQHEQQPAQPRQDLMLSGPAMTQPAPSLSSRPQPGSQRLNLIEPGASPAMPAPHIPYAATAGQLAGPGPNSYNEAMAIARQMGMASGPGQMFPLPTATTTPYPASLPVPSPAIPNETRYHALPPQEIPRLPSSVPAGPQAGLQTQPSYSQGFGPGLNPPMTTPASEIQQVANEQPNSESYQRSIPSSSTGTTGVVRDWPYAPATNSPPAVNPQPAAPAAGSSHSPTPWFNSPGQATSHSQQHDLPRTMPQPTQLTPQQWPHSPQAQMNASNSTNAPVIHRGTQPGSSSQLPQVVPGNR
ncbi:MAG: tetratricopeptide repeat protein [Planctomycetaceae bacterium]|nr:tetratricopeptide repeat protein [Planctomycetaceae bacterium]